MNNKGFTLIEMLAVVVILAILSGIAVNGVLSYIETSKKKSEEIFVGKLETYIDNYLDLYKGKLSNTGTTYTFQKCKRVNKAGECYDVTAYQLSTFNISDFTNAEVKLTEKENLINPANKKQCFTTANPSIQVYKDTDFVYYYYLDLRNTVTVTNNNCELDDDNAIITNLPKALCQKIFGESSEECQS